MFHERAPQRQLLLRGVLRRPHPHARCGEGPSTHAGKPKHKPHRRYCTERTLAFCDGTAEPCDGPKRGGSNSNATCRFGNPDVDCSAGTFTMLAGETEVTMRMLEDRAIVEAFVMRGRPAKAHAFRPYDQSVPGTEVRLVAWTPLVVRNAWSMGCGWLRQ